MTSPATPTSAHPLFTRCFFKICPYIWTSCSHFFYFTFFSFSFFFPHCRVSVFSLALCRAGSGVSPVGILAQGHLSSSSSSSSSMRNLNMVILAPKHMICHPAANSPPTPGYKNTQMWCCGHKNTNSSLCPPLHNSFSSFSLFVH